MREQWRLWLPGIVLVPLCLSVVSSSFGRPGGFLSARNPLAFSQGLTAHASMLMNVGSFVLSSGRSQQHYTISTSVSASMLRHGHQEFTIDLVDPSAHLSLIMAFIGYHGPGSYLLENQRNGGDVRVTIGQQYWDLALVPTASCRLTIISDQPKAQPDLDMMTGTFTCLMLPPGASNTNRQAVALPDGRFAIVMVVVS